MLRPAFQLAVDDDNIRKNPFDFPLMSVVYNDSITRQALSYEYEKKFLNFIKNDNHFSKYYDGIFILFNTGLRISEFVGLTMKDIDFANMCINVDHQLQRYPHVGYEVVDVKTESGERKIPMTKEVADAFRRIIKRRKKLKVENYFRHALTKYNATYKAQLPKITPHVARHTFCSRMAAKRMNPKVLQQIMGHSDISVTMNI